MKAKRRRAARDQARCWLVNPGGAIHEVTRELAAERLHDPGWRLATDAEVAELKQRGGHQSADNPICEPQSPEPDEGASDDGIDGNAE